MNRRSIWGYSGAPAINLDDPQSVARVQGAEERKKLRADAAHEQFRRGLRRKLFGPNLFGEPGWDILLALYVIDDVKRWMSIAELTAITHVPLTTSLRWLAYLEEQDFVSRLAASRDSSPWACAVSAAWASRSSLGSARARTPYLACW